MAVPKLRFKADDGSDYPEWNDFTRLENISAFITKGATPTTYGFDWQPNGVYFFRNDCIKNNVFVYGDYSFITEEANKFLQRSEVTGGDIIIAITGDIGKVGLIPSEVKKGNINQHLARVRIVKNTFPYFVYMYLCSDKVQRTYKKIKTGLSMPQLSLAQIRDTNIPVVSLPEQQKITEFLSTVDTVIEKQKATVEAWEERKKGAMQKLFSQEVRFKADDGSEFPEWEEKKLSEMFKKVVEKNRLDLPALTIIQGSGTIRRDESERRITYDEKGLKNYKAVHKNDFIVHLRSFEGGLEIANQDGFVSPAYHVYRGNDEVNSLFYYPYFRSSNFINGKLSICVTGVRDGKNIEMSSFDELLIPHPCFAEQQKIADCLSSLDDVIKKQKATLVAWEEMKKGLLQQMFV